MGRRSLAPPKRRAGVTKLAGSFRSIEDAAPAGSTIIRGHGSHVIAVKVGHTYTVDGEVLGRVAATEYDHGRRELLVAVVPELVYWHLKLRHELMYEGWGEVDAPLTIVRWLGHEDLERRRCSPC